MKKEERILVPHRSAGVDLVATRRRPYGEARGGAVVAHGLLNHKDSPLIEALARYLSDYQGLITLRFDFAAHGEDARERETLGFHTFADDVSVMVQYAQGLTDGPVLEIGHSAGGKAIVDGRPLDLKTHLPTEPSVAGNRPHELVVLIDASHSDCARSVALSWHLGDYGSSARSAQSRFPGQYAFPAFVKVKGGTRLDEVVFPTDFARWMFADSAAAAQHGKSPLLVVSAAENHVLRPYTEKYAYQWGSNDTTLRCVQALHDFDLARIEPDEISTVAHNFRRIGPRARAFSVIGDWLDEHLPLDARAIDPNNSMTL